MRSNYKSVHLTVLPISTFMCLKLCMKRYTYKWAACHYKSREPSNSSESYLQLKLQVGIIVKYTMSISSSIAYHIMQTQFQLNFYLKFTVNCSFKSSCPSNPTSNVKVTEVVVGRCSVKNVFGKNTCARVSFLVKL